MSCDGPRVERSALPMILVSRTALMSTALLRLLASVRLHLFNGLGQHFIRVSIRQPVPKCFDSCPITRILVLHHLELLSADEDGEHLTLLLQRDRLFRIVDRVDDIAEMRPCFGCRDLLD